jgi:hypothetical protein
MNTDPKNVNDKRSQENRVGKPYKSPKLEMYGGLSEIVQTVGATGKNDGGGSPPQKTSLP